MKTSKQREEDFLRDWERLLAKHGAVADRDHANGPTYITMYSVPDEEGDHALLEEGAEFDLF